MTRRVWPIDVGMNELGMPNSLVANHVLHRYVDKANMMSVAERLKGDRYITADHVRVEIKSNGYYDVLTLDNIWDKSYKREYHTYDDLPEEMQRKLAVLQMVERTLDDDGIVGGVGKRVSSSVFWINIEKR